MQLREGLLSQNATHLKLIPLCQHHNCMGIPDSLVWVIKDAYQLPNSLRLIGHCSTGKVLLNLIPLHLQPNTHSLRKKSKYTQSKRIKLPMRWREIQKFQSFQKASLQTCYKLQIKFLSYFLFWKMSKLRARCEESACLGIIYVESGPFLQQVGANVNGRALTGVTCVLLEGEAKHCQALVCHCVEEALNNALGKPGM